MRVSGLLALLSLAACAAGEVPVRTDPELAPREAWGVSKLRAAAAVVNGPPGEEIFAGLRTSKLFDAWPALARFAAGESEAFVLRRIGKAWLVAGSDASGLLYGTLELASRIRAAHSLPALPAEVRERPAFKLRGSVLFWMKWGSLSYDWPVTPENFPWFFDRELMARYLDQLAESRFNMLCFWNGHPFPYLLELARYPEARMLSAADLARNVAQFRWFTQEADRRGIWTVLHFYNIHVPASFAAAHASEGVRVQNAAATPLLNAYMRYAVAELVKSYPSVGIMVTAGEALRVKQEEYVRDAIVAGIRDSGRHPPLIVRQWTIDPGRYREIIQPSYDNLFTMMKHNTEMIVSPYPDPRNAAWVGLGQGHIVNVHENADIKPFRWASPLFVQQMTSLWQSMGASGFHLYSLVSWQWPVSLDRSSPPLSAIDRDRFWICMFGRYGWNPRRAPDAEEQYWRQELGGAVYDYYVRTGPVLPALQNLVNIYNMNFHPTAVAQEATLEGILRADRWEDIGNPLPQPLDDFTLAMHERRVGKLTETARSAPPRSVKEFVAGKRAEAIDPQALAETLVAMAEEGEAGLAKQAGGADEFQRLRTDARCIASLARFYRAKIAAACEKGRFDASGERSHFDAMLGALGQSVREYRELDRVASAAYRQPTDLGDWYQWSSVLREFEQELEFYREQGGLARTGAEVVYLGLNGPMEDAGNAFHWLLERERTAKGWKSQSCAFGSAPFARATLAVAYDLSAASFERLEPALVEWVRAGGKLLIWDPLGRAQARGPLLAGLRFTAGSAWRSTNAFAFAGERHQLTQSLEGRRVPLWEPRDTLAATVAETGPEWTELAYTVLPNVSARQFSHGDPTFGPRWTSLLDRARRPVLLVRGFGSGSVAFAQLGTWTAPSGPNVRSTTEGSALEAFVRNLLAWTGDAR